MRRLAQGHLDPRQGGAGDRTSNLPATSQPALPPEPYAAQVIDTGLQGLRGSSEGPRGCNGAEDWFPSFIVNVPSNTLGAVKGSITFMVVEGDSVEQIKTYVWFKVI